MQILFLQGRNEMTDFYLLNDGMQLYFDYQRQLLYNMHSRIKAQAFK